MKRGVWAAILLTGCIWSAAAVPPWTTPAGVPIPNPPTFDITNIIHAIENGYKLYEQLSSMYNNVQSQIEQLQEVKNNFEAFDVNQLNASDPLGSWRKIMTYGNRMMNYANQMENIINKKSIKIGNARYSFHDLYAERMPVGDMISNTVGFVVLDPFERELTPHEKALFHQKYGMSYGNYMRYHAIGEATTTKAMEINAFNEMFETEIVKDHEAIQALLDENSGGEASWVGEQQKVNALLMIKNKEMKLRTQAYVGLARVYSDMAVRTARQREINEEQRRERYFDAAQTYVDMLNDDGTTKSSQYKGSVSKMQ